MENKSMKQTIVLNHYEPHQYKSTYQESLDDSLNHTGSFATVMGKVTGDLERGLFTKPVEIKFKGLNTTQDDESLANKIVSLYNSIHEKTSE
jgi:hypothetical protein